MIVEASLLDWRFVVLLIVIAGLRQFVPARHYVGFGMITSVALLAWTSIATTLIIGGITLLYIFPIHRLLRHADQAGWSSGAHKVIYAAGLAGLVLMLVVFKVHRKFELPGLGGGLPANEALGLIGFSYFIFRALQFLHIQHLVKFTERSPATLLFFSFFPPTLSSGPIQKYQDFRAQVASPEPLSWALIKEAGYRITLGYFRKLALAYPLSLVVANCLARPVFDPLTSLTLIVAFYLYLYFDFAGYSDIAIGFGLLLGIRVPENFRKPFGATTVAEFWRNWHITLVDWFRDQVFVPLGGRHASKWKAAALSIAVMGLCGLWHGLAWNFVLWGIWHGGLLAMESVLGVRTMPPSSRSGWRYVGRVAFTNAKIALGALLFLPDPQAIQGILTGLFRW